LIDGLLEPAVLREQIHAAVAVDVSSTVAMRVAKIPGVVLGRPRRDRMEAGLAERVGPVDLGKPELSAPLALRLRRLHEVAGVDEQFGLAIAGHVDEPG
jgi:hypothetical protein